MNWLKRWWTTREFRRSIDDIVRTMIAHEDPAYLKSLRDMTKEEMDARRAQIEKRQKELQDEIEACRSRNSQLRAEAAEHRAATRLLQKEHAAWKASR